MRRHSTARFPVVAIAVLALLMGSLGFVTTSHAAGLTTKQVKRIAAKVVKKKAPKLTVKHAATAGDAATLGGSSPAELRTRAYTFTMPTQPAALIRGYSFPGLPVGTYLASYAYTANTGAVGTVVGCSFSNLVGNLAGAPSYSADHGAAAFARGSATAVVRTTADTRLTCSTTGTFSMNNLTENTVSFVPIDNPTATPAGTARGTG